MGASRFLAAAVVVAAMIVASCGGSPTGPAAVADFQGVWEGRWAKTSCTDSGGASGVACSQTPQSGTLRVTVTQSENTVQGSVEVEGFSIPVTGSVSGSTLTLGGQTHLSQRNATGTVSNWSTARNGNSISGNFTLTVAADDSAFGSQILQLTLQNVSKAS